MDEFIVTYLRQLATTGAPVEEVVADAPVWRIEVREEGSWALMEDRPDGGGSEEKAWAKDRGTALTMAGIFTALASDPRGMDPELSERVQLDTSVAGPGRKELWARILRGLMRHPVALEYYLAGAGESLPPEAREILRRRLEELRQA